MSEGLDVLFGALGHEIKQQMGLPDRRPNALAAPYDFRFLVEEIAATTGFPARFNADETVAVLTVPIGGQRTWQVLACDRGELVEFIAPVGLRFHQGQVPRDLAAYILSRNPHIAFGGFELIDHEGGFLVRGRLTIPILAGIAALLDSAIHVLVTEVSEVAALYERLRQ